MPGQITHYLASAQVLAGLPAGVSLHIEKYRHLYNMGSQGPDIFFFYILGMRKKHFRSMGHKMHGSNVGAFIRLMAEGLKAKGAGDPAFAYFCGYLTHYCLDCAAHPYVYYKTGFVKKGDKKLKLRYSAYHMRFETAIDTLMLRHIENKAPKDQRLWHIFRDTRREAKGSADFIGECIRGAYNVPVSGKDVMSAMGHMIFFTKILQSGRGRRKRLIALTEGLILKEELLSSLIHPQEVADGLDYLNQNKAPWKAPWNDEDIHNLSFYEMFENGVIEAGRLIKLLYEYMEGDAELDDFLQAAGNRSLNSGRPLDEDVVFEFYDIIYKN